MLKTYIIPQLSEIKIDQKISLRLNTASNDEFVLEPGDGSAGMGGEGNGSGETGWDRGGFNYPKAGEFQSNEIWQ